MGEIHRHIKITKLEGNKQHRKMQTKAQQQQKSRRKQKKMGKKGFKTTK